jgi:nickel-dependent lactate racemase
MRVDLPYGSAPYAVNLAGRDATVLRAQELPPPSPLEDLLRCALDAPMGRTLDIRPGSRVTLIVSDATRHEPRAAFIAAVRERVADVRWTVAVATGTHGPADIEQLSLPAELVRDATIVNHDGHRSDDLVELGVTTRGTPIRVHRCLVECDQVIATGCIRPHYFAGFGAGAKALFPGLGEATAIRINHQLKTEPRSRAGIVDGNPCREDLEEAVRQVPTPAFLLNAVVGPDDAVHAAVAGDLVVAFRAGVAIARPWFTVRARPAALVIASDALPVTATLDQAAKIFAAAAPLVAENGTLVVVAGCEDGIGPLDIVNEAIFRIGVLPRMRPGVKLVLVSELAENEANRTLVAYAPSVDAVLAASARVATSGARDPILVLPHASHLIAEAIS